MTRRAAAYDAPQDQKPDESIKCPEFDRVEVGGPPILPLAVALFVLMLTILIAAELFQ